jgi:hypothetical protein
LGLLTITHPEGPSDTAKNPVDYETVWNNLYLHISHHGGLYEKAAGRTVFLLLFAFTAHAGEFSDLKKR